ncbi:hypothetical protein CEXT_340031 [Caerostris extrusa]|uniref:Uncharacterized protein n=1 Tax=Caerostris extrusa TaxID=172846 RepID=A0AAV4UDH8_CAEEX|nr:hypothetical protein CEXT_340031 [Caerostris extrusa]
MVTTPLWAHCDQRPKLKMSTAVTCDTYYVYPPYRRRERCLFAQGSEENGGRCDPLLIPEVGVHMPPTSLFGRVHAQAYVVRFECEPLARVRPTIYPKFTITQNAPRHCLLLHVPKMHHDIAYAVYILSPKFPINSPMCDIWEFTTPSLRFNRRNFRPTGIFHPPLLRTQ